MSSPFRIDQYAYEIVLAAAALHAVWNSVLKIQEINPLAKVTLFNLVPALIAAPLIPYFGLPSEGAFLYLIPAAILQIFYTVWLVWAFQAADLIQVYPIVRGAAVSFTTVATAGIFGEQLGATGWIAVFVIASGVFLISIRGGRDSFRFQRRAVCFALFAGAANSAFFVLDGFGARASGNSHGYAVTLFGIVGFATLLLALLWRGSAVISEMAAGWKSGVFSGAISMFVYWIAIWAMTAIPIPFVSALRETSVLFGALIAVVSLREPLSAPRVLALIMIVSGGVLIILAR